MGTWSRATGKERSTLLLKVADLIEANVERMALLETLESGKPISQAAAKSLAPPTSGATPRRSPAPCTVTATIPSARTCWRWC